MFIYKFDITINTTKSMPIGLYIKASNNKIKTGDIIIFNSPDFNIKLLKRVVAIADDRVDTNESGVYINNNLIKNSTIFKTDSKGHALNFRPTHKILGDDEIFLIADHEKSYDSRYFGAINTKSTPVEKVRPLITFRISTND